MVRVPFSKLHLLIALKEKQHNKAFRHSSLVISSSYSKYLLIWNRIETGRPRRNNRNARRKKRNRTPPWERWLRHNWAVVVRFRRASSWLCSRTRPPTSWPGRGPRPSNSKGPPVLGTGSPPAIPPVFNQHTKQKRNEKKRAIQLDDWWKVQTGFLTWPSLRERVEGKPASFLCARRPAWVGRRPPAAGRDGPPKRRSFRARICTCRSSPGRQRILVENQAAKKNKQTKQQPDAFKTLAHLRIDVLAARLGEEGAHADVVAPAGRKLEASGRVFIRGHDDPVLPPPPLKEKGSSCITRKVWPMTSSWTLFVHLFGKWFWAIWYFHWISWSRPISCTGHVQGATTFRWRICSIL